MDAVETGVVSSVSSDHRTARVRIDGKVSDSLQIVSRPVKVTVQCPECGSLTVKIEQWTPSVNEQVLCVFKSMRDGNGYIVGAV
jgi:phage baseplate assembly protein gpV